MITIGPWSERQRQEGWIARLYVILVSDGKILAAGFDRGGCMKFADVFSALGIPCRVVFAGGQRIAEKRYEFLARRREKYAESHQ